MQGSIRKRGKGSWAVRLDVGRDPQSGRRRQIERAVRGTKRDAEKELARLIYELDQGTDLRPERLTVGEYLKRWLADYAKPNVGPSTYVKYEEIVRIHLTPRLGAVLLGKLQPLQIQRAYAAIIASGLSEKTVLHVHRLLHEALRHALRWQLIRINVSEAVEPPRPQRYEARALNVAELLRLIAAGDQTRYGILIRLAATTGLRQGELLGLRWKDVDLASGRIYVTQAAARATGEGIVFRSPKTHRSRRAVVLSPRTIEMLQEHRWRQLKEHQSLGDEFQDSGLVFATPLSSPVDASNLRRMWNKLVKETGLTGLRFHDLRHSHATFLIKEGFNPKVVSERLGHANVGITLNTYTHLLAADQAEAAAFMDRLMETPR